MVERKLYCLARIDEKTGNILRPATVEDLQLFGMSPESSSLDGTSSSGKENPIPQETFMQFVMNGNAWCRNCGAEASPQWRRGPPPFEVLCNACGTRFRRTQALQREVPLQNITEARKYYKKCMQEALERERAERQARLQMQIQQQKELAALQQKGVAAA